MRHWLAVGEPLVAVCVPKVRFQNKDARLRAQAEAHVDKNMREEDRRVRVATMLAERREVFAVVEGRGAWNWRGSSARIPRWRFFLRRRMRKYICEGHRITKWW